MDFESPAIIEWLVESTDEVKECVPFGIIGFTNDNSITCYNKIESEYSGYSKEFVIGKNLFLEVAPCMNNYLVALKFAELNELDEVIPYILSFKVKPVSVHLRLLKKGELNYILIKRK